MLKRLSFLWERLFSAIQQLELNVLGNRRTKERGMITTGINNDDRNMLSNDHGGAFMHSFGLK